MQSGWCQSRHTSTASTTRSTISQPGRNPFGAHGPSKFFSKKIQNFGFTRFDLPGDNGFFTRSYQTPLVQWGDSTRVVANLAKILAAQYNAHQWAVN